MEKFITRCIAQWKLFKDLSISYMSMIAAVWKIGRLAPPRVTIFGGAKVTQESPYAKQAHQLAQLLVTRGVSVITGGGPGIMQAANCGAYTNGNSKTHSIGIPVAGLNGEIINTCADTVISTRHFFVRKWLLTNYAVAFAVFPGGFGTLDELFEILTLMQTHKLKRFPVILINVAYWQPLIEWSKRAVQEGLLLDQDMKLLRLTDDISEAAIWLAECLDETMCRI